MSTSKQQQLMKLRMELQTEMYKMAQSTKKPATKPPKGLPSGKPKPPTPKATPTPKAKSRFKAIKSFDDPNWSNPAPAGSKGGKKK